MIKGPFSALHPYVKKYPWRTFFGLFSFFVLLMIATNRSISGDGLANFDWAGEVFMPAWWFALGFQFALRFLFK